MNRELINECLFADVVWCVEGVVYEQCSGQEWEECDGGGDGSGEPVAEVSERNCEGAGEEQEQSEEQGVVQSAGGGGTESEPGFKSLEDNSFAARYCAAGQVAQLEDGGGGPDGWPEWCELSGVELVVDERMEYDGSAGGGVEDYRDIEPAEDSSGEDAVESE